MATVIAQRDLRNDSAEILRRVESGEEFVVTRNGTPVAELRPAALRRGVSRGRVAEAFAAVPAVDLDRLRADLDALIDPGVDDLPAPRG